MRLQFILAANGLATPDRGNIAFVNSPSEFHAKRIFDRPSAARFFSRLHANTAQPNALVAECQERTQTSAEVSSAIASVLGLPVGSPTNVLLIL
jgi:hypothetical protein